MQGAQVTAQLMDRSVLRMVKRLERYCPTEIPVKVILKDRAALYGDTDRKHDHYRVTVEAGVSYVIPLPCGDLHSQKDTLVHEWAHCVAWKADHSELQDHGTAWGLAYATCYRVVIED